MFHLFSYVVNSSNIMFKSLFANASIEIEWINNKSEMKKNKQNISEKGGKTETICLQKLTHRKNNVFAEYAF